MAIKVLLVEDEELIGEMVRLNLQGEGYEVLWLKNGEGVLTAIEEQRFDLIVLDIMLPGKDGIQVTQELRHQQIGTPIVLLTARGDMLTKVTGLDAGADDYITKPFDMQELLARMRAAIRRSQGSRETPSTDLLVFGEYEVNLRTREAVTNEGSVVLSEKECELLALLSRRRGEVLTRADMLEEVWGMDVSPTERTVDNFILRLRKLFDHPYEPRHFLTVRGIGYKFTP